MTQEIKTNESISYIKEKIKTNPTIGLILGSGLGEYADTLDGQIVIPYKDIPHFPVSTVTGHKGQLVFGVIHGNNIVCMQGRIHYYESNNMDDIVYIINIFVKLGIKILITTNATGGINDNFNVGDFMIITDHIGFLGVDPLIGKTSLSSGQKYLSDIYDDELILIAEKASTVLGIAIKKGVMAYCPGPSYETPAEIKMLKRLGADNVGMSTIPEAIVARYLNLKVLSISAITNIAAGLRDSKPTHNEVLSTSRIMKNDFKSLIDYIIKKIDVS